jgi:hypothetical protein
VSGPYVLIGIPGGRRVELFQAALARLGRPAARVVAYADLLAGRVCLPDLVPPGALVRIESPGKDFATERALLAAGAPAAAAEGGPWTAPEQIERLAFDKGRILWVRQWYLGLCAALDLVRRQLSACGPHRLMSAPDEIALMFDKRACHARLAESGLPLPRTLGPVRSYAELRAAMASQRSPRVFVKLAHGSSASGAVAYQTDGARHHATTTVEMVRAGGELRLYNSRRLRVLEDQGEIATLIDALAGHALHVEQWLPKAGIDGHTFDLRVVVIAGRARHTVVRQSKGPMTNLHLLNTRGDPERVRERLGPESWEATRRTCEQTMLAFPACHYAGIDLLVAPGYRRHAVLEVNAFGDLLPGLLDQGQDTYEAEIATF